MHYKPEHKDILDGLLLSIPGVRAGKAFGYPAYKVNGRIFAFVGGDGMALKLPEGRVHEIIDAEACAKPFQPVDGVYWREWVSLAPSDPNAYTTYGELFEESVLFVVNT